MNSRHAAAFALVGWYLMMRSTGRDYPMGNVDAPLSQWMKRPTIYSDKKECEHVLDLASPADKLEEQADRSQVLQSGAIHRDRRSAPQEKVG